MRKPQTVLSSFAGVIITGLLISGCTTASGQQYSRNINADKLVKAGGKVDINTGYYLVDRRGGGCIPRAIPVITITKQPKQGTVKIVKGRRTPTQQGCAKTTVSTVRVVYHSNGTRGPDTFEYTVRYRNSSLGTWHVSAFVDVQ